MDICEHYEQKGYKRGISLKSVKSELKPGSVAGNLKMTRKILGLQKQTSLNQVWAYARFESSVALPHCVVRCLLREVHKLIEHVVVKQRQMINDYREDREANSSG